MPGKDYGGWYKNPKQTQVIFTACAYNTKEPNGGILVASKEQQDLSDKAIK